MDSHHIKIRIGLVCVGFLIATVTLIMLFGGGKMPRLFSSDYEIYVILPQAPMLSENSPVYKNGVEIGRVTRVRLVDDDRKVEITARIKGNIKLYTNEECQLSLNLLGQSTLNFTPKTGAPLGDVLAKKSTIEGITPVDLLKMADDLQSDVSKALRSVTSVADEMKNSFGKINQLIGSPEDVAKKQQRLEHMVDQADLTMTSLNRLMSSADGLINDPDIRNGLKVSSTQLPGVIEEGKALMANINQMTTRIAGMLERVDGTITKVDFNLDNVTKFTESLGEDGPQFIQALSSAAQEFETGAAQLSEFARALNNPDGSLGQLLNDPEFFQSLNSTMKNADQTISNIKRITVQLQPILQDVNVLSDKLARKPSLLGLQGVLDKSPPTKGIPDAYANPWQFDRNGGVPQQQSERMQLIRSPGQKLWPFGRQQYRNEPVPRQNRYASQVIDLPDVFDGETNPTYESFAPAESFDTQMYSPAVYPTGAQTQPMMPQPVMSRQTMPQQTRVVVVPLQPQVTARQQQVVAPQVAQAKRNGLALEIDFEPETTDEPSPLRLVSGVMPTDSLTNTTPNGNSHVMPPLIQPLQGNAPASRQAFPAGETNPVKSEKHAENNVPNFSPIY